METTLYGPIKRFLEARGFVAKGEIGGCDVVAVAAGSTSPLVVICELKLTFTLELVLQAVERAGACDEVWLAVRLSRRGRERDSRVRALCRRLGFGLLGVAENGAVDVLSSPIAPIRRDLKRRSRLMDEHRRRQGDPTPGGGSRAPIMTYYRQQALACAAAIAGTPGRPRDLKGAIPDAPKILQGNVYGWFHRVDRGLYGLTDEGRNALRRWPQPSTIDAARMTPNGAPAS